MEDEPITPCRVQKMYFDTEVEIIHMESQWYRNTGEDDSDPDKLLLLDGFSDLKGWLRQFA